MAAPLLAPEPAPVLAAEALSTAGILPAGAAEPAVVPSAAIVPLPAVLSELDVAASIVSQAPEAQPAPAAAPEPEPVPAPTPAVVVPEPVLGIPSFLAEPARTSPVLPVPPIAAPPAVTFAPVVPPSVVAPAVVEPPPPPVSEVPVVAPPMPVPPSPVQEPPASVVVPLARNPVRLETPARPPTPARIAGIDWLLRLAAARGANTLYLMSQSRPSVRVDGEIATLEGEPVLTATEVESLLLDLAPERSREALRAGEGTEWMAEVPEVGRIRCQNFRDHRGPGGIFRMISTRPVSAEQLGLSREIQALAGEPEGLILVAGPRASGKSTLIASFVDLINRSRNDYVVTVESQIMFAHEGRGCLISQREVRGKSEEVAVAARGALRENPDVLVIEDLRSPEVVQLALDAVEGGHLVIGAISAHTAASAIARLIDQSPPERRQQVQLTLAEGLRGVVAQVLLHKSSGGRVAARELLLNTPPIANLIAEGRLSQLPLALDSGRKHGMVPLNDSLAAFVQNGVVDVREAYRKAFERQAFLAVLRREGMDTSFVERLA